jgi:hypothetical protein
MSFTNEEKAKEAEREVKMRMFVYSDWVERKRLDAATAERRIAIMKEIAAHFRELANAEAAAGRLL